MKSSRATCADCGTTNLVVPVQRLCIVCEASPRRCTPCAVRHGERNVHTGIELVAGDDGATYRRAAA